MDILMLIWEYFADNILQKPEFMIGAIVMVAIFCWGNRGMKLWAEH